MPKKLYVETVGCQMNVLDSELVAASLRKQGFEFAADPKQADVILFNTCSVRQHAEDKIYSALGTLRGHKKRYPEKIIGVLGCMAQKDQELIRRRAPHVDIVCGPGQLARVPELIALVEKTRQPQFALSLGRAEASRHEVEHSFESYDPLREPAFRPTPFQAFVRTQFGCDKFCTYCIVPSVRGPEQGRHPEHIAAEVRRLADEGCKEVTLIGQTVNSYAYDLGSAGRNAGPTRRTVRLSDLLYLLSDISGIERIKFVTNFPKDMTDDLLDAVRDLPKVCRYLHVPAQSGCDDVLKRMKRLYTAGFYRDMLARCRERVPGVAISSDFIVGFCGESEESFQRTCGLVAEAGFKNSFIFKYSPRPGTKADELFADDVPEETKRRRNNDLLAIQTKVSLADHRRWIGRTVEVLVEGLSKKASGTHAQGRVFEPLGFPSGERPGSKTHLGASLGSATPQLTGRAMTDHIVVFDGHERLIGRTVPVQIEDASAFTLFGAAETSSQITADATCESITVQANLASNGRVSLPVI